QPAGRCADTHHRDDVHDGGRRIERFSVLSSPGWLGCRGGVDSLRGGASFLIGEFGAGSRVTRQAGGVRISGGALPLSLRRRRPLPARWDATPPGLADTVL